MTDLQLKNLLSTPTWRLVHIPSHKTRSYYVVKCNGICPDCSFYNRSCGTPEWVFHRISYNQLNNLKQTYPKLFI